MQLLIQIILNMIYKLKNRNLDKLWKFIVDFLSKNKSVLFITSLSLLIFILSLLLRGDFFEGITDVQVYSDTARNIVEGKGISSNLTLPIHIPNIPPQPPWPPYYPPLYPLLIALSYKIFGVSEYATVLVSGFFFILTTPIVFLIAKKIYNEKVAIASSIWYIFTPALLNYAVSGTTEPLFTFLLILAFYLLLTNVNTYFVGIIIGLSSLVKFQGLLLLLLFSLTIFAIQKKTRTKTISLFVVGFLTIIVLKKIFLPPLATDYQTITNSQFWKTVAYESIIPRDSLARSLEPISFGVILVNLGHVLTKIVNNSHKFFQSIFVDFPATAIVMYVLALYKTSVKDKGVFGLRLFTILGIVFFALFHIVTIFDFRYLHPFLPLVLIVATEALVHFLRQNKVKRIGTKYILVLSFFVVFPLTTAKGWVTGIQRSLLYPRKPNIYQLLGKIVETNTKETDIIASDELTRITWYGNRKTILLPFTVKELGIIDKNFIPIDVLVFFSRPFKSDLEEEWENHINSRRDIDKYHFEKEVNISADGNYYEIPGKVIFYRKSRKVTP